MFEMHFKVDKAATIVFEVQYKEVGGYRVVVVGGRAVEFLEGDPCLAMVWTSLANPSKLQQFL